MQTLGQKAPRFLLACLLAAGGASGRTADTPPPLIMAPSSPWTLDYADDSCALRRAFGQGADQVYLEFRRFQPGLNLQTIIASNRMKARRTPADFSYRFNSAAGWTEVNGANSVTISGGFSGELFDVSLVDLPELDEIENPFEREALRRATDRKALEREAAAKTDSITLRSAFPRQVTLELGSLAEPVAALQECLDELITHWGIDVEAHKTLKRGPIPINLRDVSRMMSYPPRMVRQNMQGIVNIRLAVDDKGQITECHIQMPLSDPEFEKSSCADIEHEIEFDPALDKEGKPIASYWVTKINFQLR